MSKYKRFIFCKNLYKDYLILIKKKDKLVSFGEDLDIYNLFGINNINYLILDGLDIKLYNVIDNKYNYYYKINLILKILDYIIK